MMCFFSPALGIRRYVCRLRDNADGINSIDFIGDSSYPAQFNASLAPRNVESFDRLACDVQRAIAHIVPCTVSIEVIVN